MTDAQALERFETLVQTQKPADVPWEPVTDYSAEARDVVEAPHADRIVAAFDVAGVLDVGCGPGHLMRLLRERGCHVGGLDKHPSADDVMFCDIGSVAPQVTRLVSVPLVICREVLEHLTIREVAQAVRNLCALSTRFVYVTTRFAKDPNHLLAVDTSDDLDPTHITMLNKDFLRVLFVLEGFKRRSDLEAQLDWQRKGRVLVYERA